ncbi:uncharacterized protein [Prorops nasuta]|uniref:uncharacterized protein n=1 Tax=Prorops nasuta TaxID=863751 RepID=UPI0034CF2D3A
MAKLLFYVCIALLVISCVMACNPPGFPCVSDDQCCLNFICNPWASRCTKAPTTPPATGPGSGVPVQCNHCKLIHRFFLLMTYEHICLDTYLFMSATRKTLQGFIQKIDICYGYKVKQNFMSMFLTRKNSLHLILVVTCISLINYSDKLKYKGFYIFFQLILIWIYLMISLFFSTDLNQNLSCYCTKIIVSYLTVVFIMIRKATLSTCGGKKMIRQYLTTIGQLCVSEISSSYKCLAAARHASTLLTVQKVKTVSIYAFSLLSNPIKNNRKMKFLVLVLSVMLMTTLILADSNNKRSCGRHGDPCVSDSECCQSIKCHRYANRCQVQITPEELMAQREKILKRKGKDY